jgi:Mg2+-importing ATPase
MIRTPKVPFIQSRASWQVTLLTTAGIAIGTLFTFIPYIGDALGMHRLPADFFLYLGATLLCYMLLVTLLKKVFVRRYGEWL